MKQQASTLTLQGTIVVLLMSKAIGIACASQIIVGDHRLLPNTAGQEVTIQVTGGDLVSGVDLFVQVGDGGPELAEFGLPAGRRGPRITDVELIDQTIFRDVDDQPQDIGSTQLNQTAVYSLSLIGSTPAVPADGTLARLTIDTTSLYHGTWDLRLSDVLPFREFGGPHTTNFAGVPADIRNGSLDIAVTIGDLNQNEMLDVSDIDLLAEAIRAGTVDPTYDLDQDGMVSSSDHTFWIKRIARTHFGDANLDGVFNSDDLITVFQANKYNTGEIASWAEGDFTGDMLFNSDDLVKAFQDDGYVIPGGAAPAVPEPASIIMLTIGLFGLAIRRRLAAD